MNISEGNYNKKRKKVIVVGPGPDIIGGIPEYIRGLISSDLKTEYHFEIFDTLSIKTRKGFTEKSRFSIAEVINSLKVIILYISTLKKNPKAIIHVHTSSYWGYFEKLLLAEIAKVLGYKIVFHIHGGSFVNFFKKLKLKKLFLNRMSKYGSVIVLTEEMKEIINIDNVEVIPNAVEIPDISIFKKENEEITFLSVSVLEKRKRINLMLEATSVLKSRGRKFKLLVAGDGPEKDNVLKLIEEKNLSDVVNFLGIVKGKEKDALFRESDVFILASASESFGIVTIEAMSYGLGIITTPVGISPSIIEDRINGIFINIDNLEDLVEAMEKYITGEVNVQTMMQKNHLIVKRNYSWEIISLKLKEKYG